MQGSSRAAVAASQKAFDTAMATRPDTGRLADDLFGVVGVLDGSAALRRALTDPTRETTAKAELVQGLFAGKIEAGALDLVGTIVGQRWSTERDLIDTIEMLGVQSLIGGTDTVDRIEDELFRFERIIAADPALRHAITDRRADPAAKAALAEQLLKDKAQPETLRLVHQALSAPRGRRFDQVVEHYLRVIADRRSELSATVITAVDLTAAQRVRLSAALQRTYDKAIHLNVVVDPEVIGGIRVEVGDEVVDGTVLRRLDAAKRHMGG
ncbi:MAG: F0F1 ATP synthase subunit delta [Actinomycetales bacterium]|nr:MAG: F0F1 ATP synthase subunit delta [Actinomycetales bacterium]